MEESMRKMSPIFSSEIEEITLVSEEAEKELRREKLLDFIIGVSPCLLCVAYRMKKCSSFSIKACLIHQRLEKAHSISQAVYNIRMINDVICAIPTRLVSIFKDYLYLDDPTEYLRRWYTLRESTWRMPKLHSFL